LFKREETFILRDLPSVIEIAGLDALCVDQLLPAAMSVADSSRIPYAVICNALPLHLEPAVPPFVTNWGASGGRRFRRLRNLAANHLIVAAAAPLYASTKLNKHRVRNRWSCDQNVGQIQVAQIPSFLDFPRERLPSNFFYSMPWHKECRDTQLKFPWHALDGRPIVYVSLGTVQNRLESMYLSVAEACSDLDVQVVLALGRKGATLSGKLPRGAIVVEYAPQLELLRRATAVVTHAGMNTALEAMANGLPMVAIPVCNDQPGVASRLAHVGVAEVVPARRANPTNLRAAIIRVLRDPSYRAASVRMQQLIRSGPTLEQTSELIEVGLSRFEPLRRKDAEAQRILGAAASKIDERPSSL
jgi:UDP:flavonoid glycosyltransferase YjiC (YdhE family)